ncbi:CCR4-NOT core exoribonuclease subunit CCR4 KNAG_0D04840 [Huiozyma naganishii CBS 8797]|uniref:CCR4-Not complex 3'-5'-exoribonuclease subunit Ccr4 n=1 Tax=Huiozyma naganishii (strain ATCC MYA-139 / BCRC 22969 / CBS 8797 / KCTC 17520 / NBRC 10181 / NCYC 3082 / Yp74L-3) TaxID=1071383 RepID=J7RL42_HUIN7|nr:hypothetical protein KNAG_0D04840 [Kazachstania naganishii CBS 8797]CCK70223.1 hypothetical protein KNAG_0D04840 [Kazachstania naganishii CBS 8797]
MNDFALMGGVANPVQGVHLGNGTGAGAGAGAGGMPAVPPPPGIAPANRNSRQLLDYLAVNNNGGGCSRWGFWRGGPGPPPPPGAIASDPTTQLHLNAANAAMHPHLEDPALLNNDIWKLQVQLAAVSAQSLGQPNVYARQNAMKKYLAHQQTAGGDPPTAGNQSLQQLNEASMSLLNRTRVLLSEIAADSQKIKKGYQADEPTAVESTAGTPSTPAAELQAARDNNATPSIFQHKKITPFHIEDEEDEDTMPIEKSKDTAYNDQLWHALDFSNLQIFNVNKNLFKYTFLTKLYLNGNGLSTLPSGIKHLNNLRVLDLSHNRLSELPAELGNCFRLKYLYLFNNLVETLPWEMGNLCNLQFLGVEGNPLDKKLLKILLEKSITGLIFYLRDNRPEIPLVHDRPFVELDIDGEPKHEYESLQESSQGVDHELTKKSFTVLSYNTLCQHYATPKMYRYTPSWALSWEYRRAKLRDQILSYSCDIMCLQEVEARTFEDFWLPLLEKHGYSGSFHAKTRAKLLQHRDSKKVDGCCVFFKRTKFRLIKKEEVDFSSTWMKHEKFQRTEDFLNRAMNKDNIALYFKLQHIASGEHIWVATTHLHWDPKFNDVKTFQVGVLLDHLQTLIRQDNPRQDVKKAPVIICGDFNSYIDSAVYELLSSGSVKDHRDGIKRDYGYMSQNNFSHQLALNSSYGLIGELPFTNFTPSFVDVIDYIWYSTHALRIRGLLGKLDDEYISKFIGFPNDKFPSDHIPLIVRFELLNTNNNNNNNTSNNNASSNSGSRKV